MIAVRLWRLWAYRAAVGTSETSRVNVLIQEPVEVRERVNRWKNHRRLLENSNVNLCGHRKEAGERVFHAVSGFPSAFGETECLKPQYRSCIWISRLSLSTKSQLDALNRHELQRCYRVSSTCRFRTTLTGVLQGLASTWIYLRVVNDIQPSIGLTPVIFVRTSGGRRQCYPSIPRSAPTTFCPCRHHPHVCASASFADTPRFGRPGRNHS